MTRTRSQQIGLFCLNTWIFAFIFMLGATWPQLFPAIALYVPLGLIGIVATDGVLLGMTSFWAGFLIGVGVVFQAMPT